MNAIKFLSIVSFINCFIYTSCVSTTPDISHLFEPLEKCIAEHFLISLFKHYDDNLQDVVALPAKLGGLSIFDPARIADYEHEYSIRATETLIRLIMEQKLSFDHECST